jgi:two-component system response regulator RegX3
MNSNETLRVLLIEDNEDDRSATATHMQFMGLDVTEIGCPLAARELFASGNFDLVILHLALAQQESLELCRWIRAESTVPIIMLTHREEAIDEIMALSAGADDYAVKPVSPHIMSARISHQLKRSQRSQVSAPREEPILAWGPLRMDTLQHRFYIGATEVMLTKSEFQIMKLLLENCHQVLTRGQFLESLGILPGIGSDHIVDAHASRLRNKIRQHGGVDVLKAVRGVGLRLADVATPLS